MKKVNLLQTSHRDVKYSIGNRVNNIVVTICDARWYLKYQGDHFVNDVIVYILWFAPETNIMLNVN